MPDWLDQLRGSQFVQAEPVPEDADVGSVADTLPAAEELDWLQELEQMEAVSEDEIAIPEALPPEAEIPLQTKMMTPPVAGPAAIPVDASVAPEAIPAADLIKRAAQTKPLETARGGTSAHDLTEVKEYQDRLAAEPGDHVTRIALARRFLREGALDDSVREYKHLLDEMSLTDTLVEELERAVQAHPDHSDLHLILGDAYVRAGQLANAMQAYKRALIGLSS